MLKKLLFLYKLQNFNFDYYIKQKFAKTKLEVKPSMSGSVAQ